MASVPLVLHIHVNICLELHYKMYAWWQRKHYLEEKIKQKRYEMFRVRSVSQTMENIYMTIKLWERSELHTYFSKCCDYTGVGANEIQLSSHRSHHPFHIITQLSKWFYYVDFVHTSFHWTGNYWILFWFGFASRPITTKN